LKEEFRQVFKFPDITTKRHILHLQTLGSEALAIVVKHGYRRCDSTCVRPVKMGSLWLLCHLNVIVSLL